MPRNLISTLVGTLALLIGSAQAMAFPKNGENDLHCTAANGLSIHVPTGKGRFMQDMILHGSPEVLGDLVDKRAATTTEERLRLAYGFSSTCAPTNGDPISCVGHSLASTTYTYFDQAADESITVRKQLHVRESNLELSKDSKGIYQLSFKIVTHPLAGRERILEIKQALGPDVKSPNAWNPGCESVPNQSDF